MNDSRSSDTNWNTIDRERRVTARLPTAVKVRAASFRVWLGVVWCVGLRGSPVGGPIGPAVTEGRFTTECWVGGTPSNPWTKLRLAAPDVFVKGTCGSD